MTWFMDVDPVGTVRTITNGSGQYAQACTSLPFGDDQACTPAISDPSPLHFTGKPRDAETGLDDFGFRYNSSTLGRFMTLDPAGNLVASPANPQSWNQYAYVMNNPTTWTDPNGLYRVVDCTWTGGCLPCPMCGGPGGGTVDYGGESHMGDIGSSLDGVLEDTERGNEDAYQTNLHSTYVEYSFTGSSKNKSIVEQQGEHVAIQLGLAICGGEDPAVVAGCIQNIYDNLRFPLLPNGQPGGLVGGNYNFNYSLVQMNDKAFDPSVLGCFANRCGAFNSLHFHPEFHTVHMDTADPYSMLGIGALIHLSFDVIGGNTWWSGGIPRP